SLTPAFNPAFQAAPAIEMHSAVGLPVLERHPVINAMNELQNKGVMFPSRASTRNEAQTLAAAAEAVPQGALRNKMTEMAVAANASLSGSGGGSLGAAYDGSKAAAKEASVSAIRAFANKIPLVSGFLKRRDQKRALAAAQAIDPTERELSPSQVRWSAP